MIQYPIQAYLIKPFTSHVPAGCAMPVLLPCTAGAITISNDANKLVRAACVAAAVLLPRPTALAYLPNCWGKATVLLLFFVCGRHAS